MGSTGIRKDRKTVGKKNLSLDLRREMVREIGAVYGLDSPGVLSAMMRVPREEFVPARHKYLAYKDTPIPIGFGQTISQPYTVAYMTHLLGPLGGKRVLEIGTGSGYQAAILAQLAQQVYSVERIRPLARRAARVLARLGQSNVQTKWVKQEVGWLEEAPFDAILVTAGMEQVPRALFAQLAKGGVLVAPVGVGPDKRLTRYTKEKRRLKKEEFGIFHFVPFIEG